MSFSIVEYLKNEHNIQLQQQQQEALEAVEGSVLLLAVPGAGKTTVMVARIAHMITNCGISPNNILTITFSRASAFDMKNRYEMLFGKLHSFTPEFSTIHSLCFKILKSYCRLSGGVMPQLIEEIDGKFSKTSILRTIYSKINHEFLSEDIEEDLLSNLSLIKNAMLSKEEVDALESEIHNLWEIYQTYSAYKRENNLMDFDDMLGYSYTALRKFPQLLEYYRKKYPYICVDEAQDTSRLQHEIIRLIAAPKNNLFMVGDEDQSIYSFRGANPKTLLDFSKIYPNSRILKLEENFRSTKSIVNSTKLFISQNRNRYEKNMFTNAENGNPIEIPMLHDMTDEYDFVIETVKKTRGTCAVIYRNNIASIPLVDTLARNSIDFYIRDHKTSLKKHYVIGDILAFFELSFDPSNLKAFSRIFNKTNAYLKKNLLQSMNTAPLAAGETWFDRIIEQQNDKSSYGRASVISSLISSLHKMKPLKAIETILNSIGYLDFLEFSCGKSFSNQVHKISALKQLASKLSTIEELIQRIDEVDQIISEHSLNKNCNLTLTTVHSAKGLEFDTVIIIDAVDGIFPNLTSLSKNKSDNFDELEEEARLFYVACTRAKSNLIIPQSNFSGNSSIKPSCFIERLFEKTAEIYSEDNGNSLWVGMRFKHKTFGEGQVMSIDREKKRFVCYFHKFGTRTLTMDILPKLKTIK